MTAGAVAAALSAWRKKERRSTANHMKQGEAAGSTATAYTEQVLIWGREELNRADTKASILLAGSVAVIAAVIAGVVAGGWSPTKLTEWREPLWWAGTATAGVAVLLFASAIYPRPAAAARLVAAGSHPEHGQLLPAA